MVNDVPEPKGQRRTNEWP